MPGTLYIGIALATIMSKKMSHSSCWFAVSAPAAKFLVTTLALSFDERVVQSWERGELLCAVPVAMFRWLLV